MSCFPRPVMDELQLKLRVTKTCSCGRRYDEVPLFAEHGDEPAGWYSQCECGSTMFFKETDVEAP